MRRRVERGSATLLVVSMTAVLLLVGVALAGVAGVVHAHRSAQAAADLVALAAASQSGAGCGTAADVARANGAVLVACDRTGREATVRVRVPGPRLLGHRVDPTARARAGPG